MRLQRLAIQDVAVIVPVKIGDNRGWFSETFKESWFRDSVDDVSFVQENQSYSQIPGIIRGLHFQIPPFTQAKLVRCLRGSVLDVVVDLRIGSSTYGQSVSAILTAEAGEQIWVPEGFAHGFCSLTPDVEIFYKVTAPYSPECDRGIAFDDPTLGIVWPVNSAEAMVSPKDRALPRLADSPSYFQYAQH
ncbi:dTDP-4-dehydrorhamnose 3,5-epimerase [Magnetospirillum fulvum]|jgi:dTDP-4-dehydrorhamnose 3,5-epimerase|uniref:dTDP-4-dehydrorhamnose 3,5-epimerase n=1 Tax=Magnetospirillum fulvum MGU-K5 TaxID=1316936 RepID=S9S5R7_MAGFU|nr:dTDP-4-dehydrorhamnose 3,5-epimerase [Magnetospirillum fulvum]EPY01237.1 dTDP-4-dehydrorhamnose 3,5-epimerase [Magnetospirillum fulvum MGU-K5]